MENQDTIEEMLIDELPPLDTMVNIEGDITIGGLLVVDKDTYEYDDNSFKPFVSSLETLKGVIFSNQFDTILDNMIQPILIN